MVPVLERDMTLVNECDDDADEWMRDYHYPGLCWMVTR
jgi:hypothetical protein